MSINILHISDLHFRAPSEYDKNIFYSNQDFCKEFVSYIKEKSGKIDYLIFTGDAINQGYVKALEDATRFLNEIKNGLGVGEDHVLLCMGNHDFNRNELIEEEKEIPIRIDNRKDEVAKIPFNDTKYQYFKKLVNDVCKKDLNVKDAIYDCIVNEDSKFVLLGVNTCYLESYEETSHKGAIDKEQFIHKLKEVLKDRSDYKVFLAMHHNPDPYAVGNEVYNWKEILLEFRKEKIENPIIVFSGHIHYIEASFGCTYEHEGESAVVTRDDKGIYYFSAGSLLNTDYKSRSFNLYRINDSTITYHFHTHIDAEEKPAWKEYKSDSITIEKQDINSLPAKESEKKIDDIPGDNKQIEDQKLIMKYIEDNKLYYSGHFHWSTDDETEKNVFKSHGYIDINYLVSHNESLEIITRLFRTEIDAIINPYKEKLSNILLISIGMECNVIGARLSIMYPDFDISYYPRKANDHNDIETGIGLLEKKDYDTIILIKDIVNSIKGETEKLIRNKFYGKNVHLISLFYCGDIKKESIFKGFDKKTYFHSLIDDINIPICNKEEECPIIKYKLQTIYRC